MAEIAALHAICNKTYKEQGVWFLNSFWEEFASKEAELVWQYVHKNEELDSEFHAEGTGLDEMKAHVFLEKFDETLTVRDMRDKLRKTGAIGETERPKTVPLTHYLLYKYNVDWKQLIDPTRQGDKQVTARKGAGDSPEDRALLIQTKENLQTLKKLFPTVTTLEINSSFGENLLISGELGPKTLCVGDVLHFLRGDEIVCVIKITSPRWPCYKIDMKHSRTLNHLEKKDRVRGVSGEAGLAGFFCKVIQEGTISFGDKLLLVERKHPKWTLEKLSQVFYGGKNRENCAIDGFQGSEEELIELLQLEDLAVFEWRDRLQKYVEKREEAKLNPEKEENKESRPQIEQPICREISLKPEKSSQSFIPSSIIALFVAIIVFLIFYL